MLSGTLQKLDGLRVRLVALLLLAVLPAAGLATYAAVNARQDAIVHAEEEAAALAVSLNAHVERYITQTRQVLSAVANSPVLQGGSPEEISRFLARVAEQNPEFSSLLVTDRLGRVRVSGASLTTQIDLSDRDYWKQVQDTRAFSVGSFANGRVTGEAILPVAEPILGDDGEFLGIVGTGIKLAVLESFVDLVSLPEGASFSVVDRNGVVLTRHPDPEVWVGKPLGDLELAGLMLSSSEGINEAPGPDGVTRLYAYAPVEGGRGAAFVSVGIPRSTAYASVSKVVLQFALGMGIIVVLVALAAWLGGDVLVLRPLRRLSAAADELGGGDLSARVGSEGASGEIARLAQGFDRMAETVERRTKALTEAESRYRCLVESSPNGIVIHSSGRIVFANRAAAGILGAEGPSGLIGKAVLEFVHPDYRDLAAARIEDALHTGRATDLAEEKLIRLDGTEVDVEVVGIPLMAGDDQSMNTIIRDVSDRKRAEKAFRESQERSDGAQRLEAVGRLAGGIAHDFNNLLTAIIGNTELMLLEADPGSQSQEGLTEIQGAAERASALTRQLLAFSRRQAMQPHVFNLNDVTVSLAGLLERLIGDNIILAFRRDPGVDPIEADPGQIEQVIMNLVVNARDAMPEGGKLTIETGNVDLDEDYASSHLSTHPGPHVLLAVTDTGAGINSEILPHIFEPFFTTKEDGKGTGLGLSTVYGIVKQSGGNIWVYSEPGVGTTFKIYFPRADRPVDWAPETRSVTQQLATGGCETILVVEDEASVRTLVVRILEKAGYTVLQEGSPESALGLYEERGGHVHLLLTDVVLPGMSGRTLAEHLVQRQDGLLRVLFMSGYTQNAIIHGGRLDAGMEFLEKPFTPDTLLRKVREALDPPPEGQLEMLLQEVIEVPPTGIEPVHEV